MARMQTWECPNCHKLNLEPIDPKTMPAGTILQNRPCPGCGQKHDVPVSPATVKEQKPKP